MAKSINLREQDLEKGKYIQVSITPDLVVNVSAVYVENFRKEAFEDNGSVRVSYDVAPLDATFNLPAIYPEQEVILLGQFVKETKRRFFPFEAENYKWLKEFEGRRGDEFFRWNEESFVEPRQAHKPRLAQGIIVNQLPV